MAVSCLSLNWLKNIFADNENLNQAKKLVSDILDNVPDNKDKEFICDTILRKLKNNSNSQLQPKLDQNNNLDLN